jgi:hypothetical protein
MNFTGSASRIMIWATGDEITKIPHREYAEKSYQIFKYHITIHNHVKAKTVEEHLS